MCDFFNDYHVKNCELHNRPKLQIMTSPSHPDRLSLFPAKFGRNCHVIVNKSGNSSNMKKEIIISAEVLAQSSSQLMNALEENFQLQCMLSPHPLDPSAPVNLDLTKSDDVQSAEVENVLCLLCEAKFGGENTK